MPGFPDFSSNGLALHQNIQQSLGHRNTNLLIQLFVNTFGVLVKAVRNKVLHLVKYHRLPALTSGGLPEPVLNFM